MDFIRQLKAFDEQSYRKVTPNAYIIYFKLFMINNNMHWEEWFEVSDSEITFVTGIKRRESIVRALNLLKQHGFLDFRRGGSGRTTSYRIVPLSNSASNPQNNSQPLLNSASDSASDSASFTSPLINNKNVNVKVNVKRGTRFVPPTLSEVNEYVIEKNLHVSAKKFWEYYDAGSWKDAKGNPVRNWKQKILTWESHEKKPASQAASPQNDIDRAIEFFESQEEGTA